MKIYLVGGAVRDKRLGDPVKEKDWVVVGTSIEEMLRQGFRSVGKDFPVFLHPETKEEYALARTERKVGKGYTGFTFDTSAQVTLEEDLKRRDLTINAMAETSEGELIDPYHGEEDLKNKILRHVSDAFVEDPVRILRVARFAARYTWRGFKVAPETIDLMKKMVLAGEVDALVAERVWKELERALTEKNPEEFFHLLEDCDALPVLFRQITSAGIKNLKKAAEITPDAEIRFACLLSDIPESEVKALCERYRVPSDYRDLALLWPRKTFHTELPASPLTEDVRALAAKALKLLKDLDAFRREKRFKKILKMYDILLSPSPSDFLRKCFQAAKSVDIQELINAGFTNAKLAEKIKEKQLEAIQNLLEK